MLWFTAPSIKIAIVHWISVGLLVQLIAWFLDVSPDFNPLWLLSCAYATFIAAVVLQPAAQRTHLDRFLWSIGAALVFYLSVAWTGTGQYGLGVLLKLSLGVMVLVWFATTLGYIVASRLNHPEQASMAVLLIIGLATTAPVWLGPIVELFASQRWLADAVISVSPLSYLSVLAEIDYLRTDWFYRSTPFGGLRFEYPSPFTVTLVLLTVSAVASLAGKNFQETR